MVCIGGREYLLPVAGFGGEDVADAAAGVGDVAGVARDDLELELGHGLAGVGAVVQVEVEGVGCLAQIRGQVLWGPVDPRVGTSAHSCFYWNWPSRSTRGPR